MKRVCKVLLPGLLYLASAPIIAQEQVGGLSNNPFNPQQANKNSKDLVEYLVNLGLYLGYDLKQSPPNATPKATLLDAGQSQVRQTYAFNAYLGALPVSAFSQAFSYFLPNAIPASQAVNLFANYTFKSQNYNAPQSRQQGKIAVSKLMDQQTYQQDPVDQAVLNILGTPDLSYCLNNDESQVIKNCDLLNKNRVMKNIMGKIPNPQEFFTYKYNQEFMSQLNSNILVAPLLYTTEDSGSSTSSSGAQQQGEQKGLTANNQAQQAANFILYASGLVSPPELPNYKEYSAAYSQATSPEESVAKLKAQGALASYFMKLRIYAAQASVGISNFYSILSKRLPQNFGSGEDTLTSQALTEFNMATWRLFKPQSMSEQSGKQQWINKINSSSSATVQKEIAILLAEINYQMYLNRQQQERLLLTNTIMMMQGATPASTSQISAGLAGNQ